MRILCLLALLASLPAYSQRYDLHFFGGFSRYSKLRFSNTSGSDAAGFARGFSAGLSLGHDLYSRIGGEVRYSYLRNEAFLESGSDQARLQAQSHVLNYDLLLHAAPLGAKVRPYAAIGGGFKQFQGTGAPNAHQPGSDIAVLTQTSEFMPALSLGGGVKIAVAPRTILRLDVHDYVTAAPERIITPVGGSMSGGPLHNLVVSAGIGFRF